MTSNGASIMKRVLFLVALSGCASELPALETSSVRVAQCALDSDCPVDRPACVTGVCQPCADARHCSDQAPVCSENQCIECSAHDDCPDGKAICQAQRCIDCLEDLHCGDETPVCVEQQCVDCRSNSDCPLDRGVCSDNRCILDPDGRSAWDHIGTVLPGATRVHGVELGHELNLLHMERLRGRQWTVGVIEGQTQLNWGVLQDAQGRRIALHNSGLIVVEPAETDPSLWLPEFEDVRDHGPGIRRDRRGVFGYDLLHDLIIDLAHFGLFDSNTPVKDLNSSRHRFINGSNRYILVDDILYGKAAGLNRDLTQTALADLKSRYWPEPTVTSGNTYRTSYERNLSVRLNGPSQLKVTTIHQELIAVYPAELPDDAAFCEAQISVQINGNTPQTETVELAAGEHSIQLLARSSDAEDCQTQLGPLTSAKHPPSWWRLVIESDDEIELLGWDYGPITRASFNQNHRPTSLSLLAGDLSDQDGDHWPDASDLCPEIKDEQLDGDQDGIGNRCDGVMSLERVSENTVAAWNQNDEELFRTEASEYADIFTALVVEPKPFAHLDDINGLASEQALIIKPSRDRPVQVFDSSGAVIFEALEGEGIRLQGVSSDGFRLGLMGYSQTPISPMSETRTLFSISNIGLGSTRKTRSFFMRSKRGKFVLVPRSSVASPLLRAELSRRFINEPMMTIATTQKMVPIHVSRLAQSLLPGFNGTCTSDAQCVGGSCGEWRCTIGGVYDHCEGSEETINSFCYPNSDRGYCIDRSGSWYRPSSFRACAHERTACETSTECAGGGLCVMGRCKSTCTESEDCAQDEVCMGAMAPMLGELGVCASSVADPNCEASERCYAASDVAFDLSGQMYLRSLQIQGNTAPKTTINALLIINLLESAMQNGGSENSFGEFGWCLPELTGSNQNSLSESQSRTKLRQIFDNQTPWNELFTLGQFTGSINTYTNLWGFNHAWSHQCETLYSKWQATFPDSLIPQSIEMVDIDGDEIEEFRVGFSINPNQAGDATTSTWRCYNVFGEQLTGNCTP